MYCIDCKVKHYNTFGLCEDLNFSFCLLYCLRMFLFFHNKNYCRIKGISAKLLTVYS
jgi:hypothetical protein